MNASHPRVSVLITAYNREDYLADAISSVLASHFSDIEVVVVDDCSTDGTWTIAQEFLRDTRVRVFRNTQNLGDNVNRNRAAAEARGDYLKYLDSDDILYPHALGVLVRAMDTFPEAGFGLSEHPLPDRPYPLFLSPHDAYATHFFEMDLFGRAPGSSIIRREVFESVAGFGEFKGRGQQGDLDLWLRLAKHFGMVCLQRDLVWDRRHEGQESTIQQQFPFERAREERKLMREALFSSDSPLSPAERLKADKRLEEMDAGIALRHVALRGAFLDGNRYRVATGVRSTTVLRMLARRLFKRA